MRPLVVMLVVVSLLTAAGCREENGTRAAQPALGAAADDNVPAAFRNLGKRAESGV